MKNKKTLKGIIFSFLGGSCWGISGTCGQYVFTKSTIDPGALTAIRMLFSGILLLGYCFIKEKKNLVFVWKEKKDAVWLLVYTLAGLVFIQYSYLTAIHYSNSGTATTIQYTGIVMIMFVSCLIEKRKPVIKEITAAVLALSGIFVLATHGKISTLVLSPPGLIWGLLAAVALTSYTILPTNLIKKWGTFLINGIGMFLGGILLSLVFTIWKKNWEYSLDIWLAIIGVVIIGTLVATCLYSQGVAQAGSVKASLAACVEPLVASLTSACWLHTNFTSIDILGFVIIMLSVIIANKSHG